MDLSQFQCVGCIQYIITAIHMATKSPKNTMAQDELGYTCTYVDCYVCLHETKMIKGLAFSLCSSFLLFVTKVPCHFFC